MNVVSNNKRIAIKTLYHKFHVVCIFTFFTLEQHAILNLQNTFQDLDSNQDESLVAHQSVMGHSVANERLNEHSPSTSNVISTPVGEYIIFLFIICFLTTSVKQN
jgi:hypothetical protein